MTHDRSHEALLEALLVGDARADAGPARAQLAECGACRERWQALSRFTERIDAVGRETRAVLADAARPGESPGSDRVRATLDREAGRAPTVALVRKRIAPALWLAAVAAAVMLVFAYRQLADRAPQGDGLLLGSDTIERVSPGDEVSVFDVFEWSYARADGHRFTLVVTGADGGPIADENEIRRSSATSRIELDPTETRAWPDRIRWRIYVEDATGNPVDASDPFYSRRSR